jgi:predicted O-methyltransferase YrrM
MPRLELTAELDAYMEGLIAPRDAVLARMEREAESEGIPAVGPQEGALLGLLAGLARPRRMLELGTAIGYSGIWLLRGAPDARLVTLEADPVRAGRARANFADAGFGERVEVVEAEAVGWLEKNGDGVDLVFQDLLNSFPSEAAVERSFQLSLGRLQPGGLLIADNALRFGQVVRPDNQQARNVVRWNRLVADSPRLEGLVIPLRDGVDVARVLA